MKLAAVLPLLLFVIIPEYGAALDMDGEFNTCGVRLSDF